MPIAYNIDPMQISSKVKKQLRWQNNLFVILFLTIIGLLAWLSLHYEFEADWTNNQRNTPSEATLNLLDKVAEPILIQAFVSGNSKALSADIEHLVKSYQRFNPNIRLSFVDPSREPKLVREIGIRNEGELLVNMSGRQEHITVATEQELTNAIQRLANKEQNWLLFLEGHNERSPYGDSNFDYTSWLGIMKSKGLLVRGYNLASNPNIPVNTSALVIADPQKTLLAGEIRIITDYIDQGGNILWLIEPGDLQGLEPVAELLGVEILQGMVVDPNTQLLGINDSRFTLIPEYPRSAITENLDSMTVFPTSIAMEFFGSEDWDAETLLETLPRTWSETDEISVDMTLDPGQDIPGPLVIGVSLNRQNQPEKDINSESNTEDEELLGENENEELDSITNQQRIVIIGDSDFASDAYIGQAGNLDFAMSIINWLTNNDNFISIPNKTNTDSNINLSKTKQAIIGFGFLLVIPLSLFLIGLIIWLKRKKH